MSVLAPLKRLGRRVWFILSCRPSGGDIVKVVSAAAIIAVDVPTLQRPDSSSSASGRPDDEKHSLPPTSPIAEPESEELPTPPTSRDDALAAVQAARQFASTLPSIELQVDQFKQWSNLVVGALDALGGLHPIVQGVAQVVKVAVQFEVQRRDNDRRVLVVKVALLQMADALFDILHIDETQLSSGELHTSLHNIVSSASVNARECSEACETYMGLNYFAKLLDGSRWDNQFTQFMQDFQLRRNELILALAIRNANAINDVGRAVTRNSAEIMDQVKMLRLLHLVQTPQERQLVEFINSSGGSDRFLANESSFETLQVKASELAINHKLEVEQAQLDLLENIRTTLNTDIKSLLQEHQEEFNRNLKTIETNIKREKLRQATLKLNGPPILTIEPPPDVSQTHEKPEHIFPVNPVSPSTSVLNHALASGAAAVQTLRHYASDVALGDRTQGFLSTVYNTAVAASQETIARVPAARQHVASVSAATGKAIYRLAAASQEALNSVPAPPFQRSRSDSMPGGWSSTLH